MTCAAPCPEDLRAGKVRKRDAGMTLVEILVVLVIVGVMASVLGLSVSGGSRSAGVLEREATLLSVRLERAAADAVLTGQPAGFTWDDEGYSFVSLQDGAWLPHVDGVLAQAHETPRRVEMSVFGQRRGQYLIRSDLLPSLTNEDTNSFVPLQVSLMDGDSTWFVLFDGVSAQGVQGTPRMAMAGGQP